MSQVIAVLGAGTGLGRSVARRFGREGFRPVPRLSGLGPVMAATRNYLYSLNAELAGTGIYAGTLSVASLIDRSEVGTAARAAFAAADGPEYPAVDPDELAEQYWTMHTTRDRVERFNPEELASSAAR